MSDSPINPLSRTRSFGWWSLLCWLTLGITLEALHGFKIGWYLDVVNEGRRLQLTLAHAHGTLLAAVNIGFAASFDAREGSTALMQRAAWCLRWSAILMPVGFLLGGVQALGPDPGFAVALVPIGGLLLFVGVLNAARSASSSASGVPPPAGQAPASPMKYKTGKKK